VPGRPRPLQKGFWQAGILARGAGWAGATAGTGVGRFSQIYEFSGAVIHGAAAQL